MSNFFNPGEWRGKLFSCGWVAAAQVVDVIEPATGEVLTSTGSATHEEVRRATQAAKAAQAKWVAMDYKDRAGIFRRAATLLEQHFEEITPWIVRETGAVPGKAQFELANTIGYMWEAAAMPTQPQGVVLPTRAGRLSLQRRIPHGVVGVITPFNFPMVLSMQAVAPALATGNAVVLKPDLRTPVTGGYIIARVLEEAGLPTDVLHVLPGDAVAGEALVTDPAVAMISFTGSTAAGRRVGELASKHLKKVTLELGGKNSLIVLDDADLDLAASNAAWGSYLHQGQICIATGRVLAHRSVAAEIVERLAEKANHLSVGNPATQQVALGPLIDRRQLEKVDTLVRESVAQGAKLKAGGTYEKLFYRPTVLAEVKPNMRVYNEEVFGPVATVITFDSEDEAISIVNSSEYGFVAGVISSSVARALHVGEQLKVGMLHINDQTVDDEAVNTFGGFGASGNGGRHGGVANWDEYTQWQWVTIKDRPTAYPF